MPRYLSLVLLVLVSLPACSTRAPTPTDFGPRSLPVEGFWKHWGDGKAEVAGYQLTQPRYGELRTGEAVLITVTEDFTRAGRVKTNGGNRDEYPVVKLNEIRHWQTGSYDYNVMTSSFLPLDGSNPRGLPTKISFSSQEWCGHIWEQLRVDESGAGRVQHSYFDGEADWTETLPITKDSLFADPMPLIVRGLTGPLMKPGEVRTIPWMRSSFDRRLNHEPNLWGQARLERSLEAMSITVPAGQFQVTEWKVDDGVDQTSWFVEVEAPHRLIAWEVSDGERGELTGAVRSSYWQKKRIADPALRS